MEECEKQQQQQQQQRQQSYHNHTYFAKELLICQADIERLNTQLQSQTLDVTRLIDMTQRYQDDIKQLGKQLRKEKEQVHLWQERAARAEKQVSKLEKWLEGVRTERQQEQIVHRVVINTKDEHIARLENRIQLIDQQARVVRGAFGKVARNVRNARKLPNNHQFISQHSDTIISSHQRHCKSTPPSSSLPDTTTATTSTSTTTSASAAGAPSAAVVTPTLVE